MGPDVRKLRIVISVMAWGAVCLAASYRSHTPVVFGRYSLNYTYLLGLLVGLAVMLSLDKASWYRKLYQSKTGIVVSVVSLLVSIVALELAVRLVDPFGISYYAALKEYSHDKLADDHLGARHKASWERQYGQVLVTYNERGLRDRPILSKAEGEYRILALGDSVTFGWGVDQDKTFPVRLEQSLQDQLHRPVRVINSGVAGYNTVQEVTYFKQEGILLQPDLVILTYVQNDIEEFHAFNSNQLVTMSDQSNSIIGRVQALVGKLWLYRLAYHTYNYGSARASKKVRVTAARDSLGWRQSMGALRELASICRKRHIPLMIFFERSSKTETTTSLLQDVVRNAPGIRVVDMAPWYEGLDARQFMNSKVDSHPNAEGHRLIANHMTNDIVSSLGKSSPQAILASHR